jgi:hypothetical protein
MGTTSPTVLPGSSLGLVNRVQDRLNSGIRDGDRFSLGVGKRLDLPDDPPDIHERVLPRTSPEYTAVCGAGDLGSSTPPR